eukprot:1161282-Pelagomonas_calceolata.AAC.9
MCLKGPPGIFAHRMKHRVVGSAVHPQVGGRSRNANAATFAVPAVHPQVRPWQECKPGAPLGSSPLTHIPLKHSIPCMAATTHPRAEAAAGMHQALLRAASWPQVASWAPSCPPAQQQAPCLLSAWGWPWLGSCRAGAGPCRAWGR